MNTVPPILAFGITNLAMLGWLAVAAAPILIHLWSRRRYREMSWAAMEFLLAALRQSRRRLRFEQWLLLLIRTLIVVLVVLAVAEPYLQQGILAFTPGGARTHRVLVIDGSYSMAYRPTDKSRFEQAKDVARQIVHESPRGDGFSLVLMSDPPRAVVGTPALEPEEFLREIDGSGAAANHGRLAADARGDRRGAQERPARAARPGARGGLFPDRSGPRRLDAQARRRRPPPRWRSSPSAWPARPRSW